MTTNSDRPAAPFAVRTIEHRWIQMPDGVRLSARMWLPRVAGPVPAILEYIPYRKRDMVRARDARNHPVFAAQGFACLRVDMRGSGDSEGTMPDMYAPKELSDARAVIAWVARQPWCNGRVGMFGTSWGGTASLQAAVDAPAALKAVIANCATIDRYEDDIHWMGGALLTDTLEWGATLPAILAAPPDSGSVGPAWRTLWEERLGAIGFPHETWLRQADRDPYWRHGSVRDDASRLSCPILAVGGWADRYANSVMPLVAARPDICRGIIGPWGHHYPDQGEPGPAISFQDVALEWWNRWLKEDAPAAPDPPALRVWRREFDPPQDRLATRNGSWIALPWPAEADEARLYLADDGQLADTAPGSATDRAVPNDILHGLCAGDTGYFGRVGGLPLDQAPDDARALTFETPPLAHDMHIVGAVALEVPVTFGGTSAQLACRLCDVAPDGRANLITRTVRNLELADDLRGLRKPGPDAPARSPVPTTIRFPTTAYRIAAGHRLRLALGTSYWPLVWPAPPGARTTVRTGAAAQLRLPAEPPSARSLAAPFPPPSAQPVEPGWQITAVGPLTRDTVEHSDGLCHVAWHQPAVTVSFADINVRITSETTANYLCHPGRTDGPTCHMHHRIDIARPDGTATLSCRVTLTGTLDNPRHAADLQVQWNGDTIASVQRGDAALLPAAP